MENKNQLIELLREVQYLGGLEEKVADHLIANGVTVQKWIPVTERLPERWQNVLSVNKHGKVCFDYRFTDGSWYSERIVTHWMPLPEAPKGERK